MLATHFISCCCPKKALFFIYPLPNPDLFKSNDSKSSSTLVRNPVSQYPKQDIKQITEGMVQKAGESTKDSQREPNQTEPTSPKVLTILSTVLEKLVARNDRLIDGVNQSGVELNCNSNHLGKSLNAFHGVRAPNISIPKYLERIYKYTNCSPSCFVVGYVYIDRLVHKHPDSLVVSLNVHRLLVTSIMVASKVLDDVHYNNAFFARVGGLSNAELNKLEMELLFLLDFGVVVSSRVFEIYCLHLEKEMMGSGEGQRIERSTTSTSNSAEDVTEISVEDSHSFSPPHLAD